MQFVRETQRLLFGLMLILGIVTATATYWAVLGPERILPRDDNPRLFEARAAIERGEIYDRSNELLVESVRGENNRISRNYLYPDLSAVLGYYSLRYGVGGAEAAYDTILSGDDLPESWDVLFERDILHQPQQGVDIQLTIDAELQMNVIEAMGGHHSAAVVLSVPDGAVLALVSLPTYNANELDTTWDQLIEDAEEPFFNRALQGNYQPGTLSYTLLLTVALIDAVPIDHFFDNSTDPVEITDVTLMCLLEPATTSLTLTDAYLYGCPEPYLRMIQETGTDRISRHYDLFSFDNPYELSGFAPAVIEAEAIPETTPQQNFRLDDAFGQGTNTVTPLHMAALTAAIINGGNAPQPQLLQAIRTPDATAWEPTPVTASSIAITTPEIARRLQDLMRQSAASGTAQHAARPGIDIGGQAALAYAGDQTFAWFIGFAQQDSRQGVVVALILEDSSDFEMAAEIGGTVLQAAFTSLYP